ncbi:hypothetical protein HY413_02680 [Candidatus Kaiserbacteria bacterium]|nr:hypothetical protein [Candidatus Kaiserbacteria bacterium]
MPNHFHLLLHESADGGISTFMNKLGTAFSMYMNTKYQRTGPLMCRPFRSRHIDSDEYFRWVFAYIHLNPVELVQPDFKSKGIIDHSYVKAFLEKYPYSSYPDHMLSEREESAILTPNDEVKALLKDTGTVRDLEEVLHAQENREFKYV